MKYRNLGKTGYSVSELGFGTWGIGGQFPNLYAYGSKNDSESKEALLRASSLGINFFDTSSSYGCGHAETLLGEVFRELRDKVFIATKGGYLEPGGSLEPFSPSGNNQSFYYKDIEDSIHRSLARLQSSYIDLFQLHDCSIEDMVGNIALFRMLAHYKKQGVLRAIGFAGKSSKDTLKALDIFDFDCVQIGFSLVDMRPLDDGLFSICQEKNIGVIARSSLAFGFISDKIRSDFPLNDHRTRFSNAQKERWANAKQYYQNMFQQYQEASWAQKALVFPLSFNTVSTVNVGMNHAWQVEHNISASKLQHLSIEQITSARQTYALNYKNIPIERI